MPKAAFNDVPDSLGGCANVTGDALGEVGGHELRPVDEREAVLGAQRQGLDAMLREDVGGGRLPAATLVIKSRASFPEKACCPAQSS